MGWNGDINSGTRLIAKGGPSTGSETAAGELVEPPPCAHFRAVGMVIQSHAETRKVSKTFRVFIPYP